MSRTVTNLFFTPIDMTSTIGQKLFGKASHGPEEKFGATIAGVAYFKKDYKRTC